MNILMTCNEKFSFGLVVTLYSLLKNTNENVYLYLSGINKDSLKNKKGIKKYIKSKRLIIDNVDHLFKKEEEHFSSFVRERFPIVSIHRILAMFLIKDIDRLLYLDSDLLIQNDLKDFYYQDLTTSIVAIKDFENEKRLEGKIDFPYFNSGVLLFNLERIRKNYIIEDIYKILKENPNDIYYPDQDILNLMFNKDKSIADFSYNHQIRDFFNEDSNLLVKENIIHYVGMPKPWMHRFDKKNLIKIYWKYAIKCSNCFRYLSLLLGRRIFRILVWCNHLRKRLFKHGK